MDMDVLFAAEVVWPKMPCHGFKVSSKNICQTYLYQNGIKIFFELQLAHIQKLFSTV